MRIPRGFATTRALPALVLGAGVAHGLIFLGAADLSESFLGRVFSLERELLGTCLQHGPIPNDAAKSEQHSISNSAHLAKPWEGRPEGIPRPRESGVIGVSWKPRS